MKINKFNGWYVLCVKSFHEKKIYNLLLESTIEAFLPLIKITKKWSDRKKVILKPLFPSYVFVKINSSNDFYKALDLYGAYSYISFGNKYAIVQDDEIHKIKMLIGDEEISNVEMETNHLTIGEMKKILFGPLKGMKCEILNVNNQNMVIVRIDSIRLNIKATVPLRYLNL